VAKDKPNEEEMSIQDLREEFDEVFKASEERLEPKKGAA
jgi:uncharacterized protein YecA (UPF0149 family)